MITGSEILDAINGLLVKKWPDRTVYRDTLPKGFVRPSFYLTRVRETPVSGNAHLLKVTGYYTILVLSVANEYGNAASEDIVRTQDEILEFFASGKLTVGDRYVDIIASAGGANEEEAYIDLQVDFFKEKPSKQDDAPLMREVQTNIEME